MTATLWAIAVGFGALFVAIVSAACWLEIGAPHAAGHGEHRDAKVKTKDGCNMSPLKDEADYSTQSGHG